MARTPIQQHSTAMVKAFLARAYAIKGLDHTVTKGQLRELFVIHILKSFLTSQFGVGSGIITNHEGKQSRQTDIIIYDNRILPPFIQEQNIGIYPIESVIATVEVKSWLRKSELLEAEKAAKKLRMEVFKTSLLARCSPSHMFCKTIPICAVFGLYGRGPKDLIPRTSGKIWLKKNVKHLQAICLANKYSWLNIGQKGWGLCMVDRETNEEMKRFIAVTLDNVRTSAELRFRLVSDEKHKDWLSAYLRK